MSSQLSIQPRSAACCGVRSNRSSSLRSAVDDVGRRAARRSCVDPLAEAVDRVRARRRPRRAPCGSPPAGGGAGTRAAASRCRRGRRSRSSRPARARRAPPSPTRARARARGLDVDRLEQLDLALDGELRPPAGEVGERAGIVGADGSEDLDETTAAEALEQRAQRRPQLASPSRSASAVGVVSAIGSARHPQAGTGADDTGADAGAARGPHDERLRAAGQRAGRLDAGEDADLRVAVADLGDEQQLARFAGGRRSGDRLGRLGRDGDDHLRHDDAAGERQRRERCGR